MGWANLEFIALLSHFGITEKKKKAEGDGSVADFVDIVNSLQNCI